MRRLARLGDENRRAADACLFSEIQNLRYSTEYTVLLLMWSLLPYLDYTKQCYMGK